MAGFLYKGILLQQHKEPALSRELREFLNADTIGLRMDREPSEKIDTLTPEEIIDLARSAGIVDERDGELLADKLERARGFGCHLLVVDAIDDEPYISSQINPMMKNQQLSAVGLSLCTRAAGAETAQFAVYKNLTDIETKIARKIGSYQVTRLRGRYPAEYQASSDFREENGVLLIGAGSVLHMARAALFSKPQTTAFVTVAGDCIGNPTNLEVSLGMTVAQTLERCGLIDRPSRVVIGGSMTGVSVIDTENTLVTPTTRAILAFRLDKKTLGLNCIGCARCVQACPEGLNPYQIYRSIRGNRQNLMRGLNVSACISCGVCSYICPSKLDLSEMISQSARIYEARHASINKSESLVSNYKRSDYTNYLTNYRFGQAVSNHKKSRRKLLRDLSSWERQASRDHQDAVNSIQGTLNQAANALRSSEAQADSQQTDAQNTMRNAKKESNRTVGAAARTHDAVHRSAERALENARKACNTTERIAHKTVQETLAFQAQMSQSTIRSAQQALTALQKEKIPATPRQIQAAQDVLNQARASVDADTKKVNISTEQSLARAQSDARAAYAQAGVICQRTKEDSDAGLAVAYQSHKKEHAQAEYVFESARATCEVLKETAHHVYEQAAGIYDTQLAKENLRHEDAMAQIRQRALTEQHMIDDILRKIRMEALAAARYAAWAHASVTGRALLSSDFIIPTYLRASEHSLQAPALRIPYDREGRPEPNTVSFTQAVDETIASLLALSPKQLADGIRAYDTPYADNNNKHLDIPVVPVSDINISDTEPIPEILIQEIQLSEPELELEPEPAESPVPEAATLESPPQASGPIVWPIPNAPTFAIPQNQPRPTVKAHSQNHAEEDSRS